MRQRLSAMIPVAVVVIAACVVLLAGLFVLWRLGAFADNNRDLSCSTARLVAYVPAIQFEGEPRANFIGWLEARRDMLIAVQAGD